MKTSVTDDHSPSRSWQPLSEQKLVEIRETFNKIYPIAEYGDLAQRAAEYWIEKLRQVWNAKAEAKKARDSAYNPEDPLSRIEQKTLVIAYPDSVCRAGEQTLATLNTFLERFFPAIRGIHMLPSCVVVEDRFNDGYFSQVDRTRIHERFGDNSLFSAMMERFYSMADFVLNHVDIENPRFQAYLNGDDEAGQGFYVFSENLYREHLANGDFKNVFRPRPFPLFSIFRRRPKDERIAALSLEQRIEELGRRLGPQAPPEPMLGLLYLFNKMKNDQMLLADDYRPILLFRRYLQEQSSIAADKIFTVSTTQEVQHVPYLFQPHIGSRADLLAAAGFDPQWEARFEEHDEAVFGEEIRTLTTFSHVQVDLNTSTLRGLQTLAEDFAWYLSMDINMLRLDAANYAFKKWKTSCYELPEVKNLMKILYLSMDAVSPRIVPNLEVNDSLSAVLRQMADKEAPPPVMYDFHLPSILPVVFNSCDASILTRIFEMIAGYQVPETSIRFSLAESHDGKSVRGSMDLLTLSERQGLADVVEANGGRIKYKSVPPGRIPLSELAEVCDEAGLQYSEVLGSLLARSEGEEGLLKEDLGDEQAVVASMGLSAGQEENRAVRFFLNKVIYGREPYELCCATRQSLPRIDNEQIEVDRYLAFYTLAFALMGRNVKSIFFNDLLALPNDHERLARSGELRDLKRTRSNYDELERLLTDPGSFESRIARGINDLIALADSDPALHFRGSEAEILPAAKNEEKDPAAVVHCSAPGADTLIIINLTCERQEARVELSRAGMAGSVSLYDNISGSSIELVRNNRLELFLEPCRRLWLTAEKIEIDPQLLVRGKR